MDLFLCNVMRLFTITVLFFVVFTIHSKFEWNQRSLETRINLSADLYKPYPGKIDCFKTGWSVFAIYQNDVLYLGVDCTPVYQSLQWSMVESFAYFYLRLWKIPEDKDWEHTVWTDRLHSHLWKREIIL